MSDINCWTDDGPCEHLNFVPISSTFAVENQTDPLTSEKTEITRENVEAWLLYGPFQFE